MTSHRNFQCYIIIGFVVMTSSLRGGEPLVLFDGSDLAAWTFHLDRPDAQLADVWSIHDGILACKGAPAGYLITRRNDFENYVLTLDWRWPGGGGNNGVLVHVTTPNELGVWPKCLEVQLEHGNAGDFWVIGTTIDVENIDQRREGRRHRKVGDSKEKALGEWNTMEITCRGDTVTVKVNGQVVNEATRVSQSRGAIALQSEGTPIEYRNIVLKTLDE